MIETHRAVSGATTDTMLMVLGCTGALPQPVETEDMLGWTRDRVTMVSKDRPGTLSRELPVPTVLFAGASVEVGAVTAGLIRLGMLGRLQ